MATLYENLLTHVLLFIITWTCIKCQAEDQTGSMKDDGNTLCQEPWKPSNVGFYASRFGVNTQRYWPGTILYFYCKESSQSLGDQKRLYCSNNGVWVPSTVPTCYDTANKLKVHCPMPKIVKGGWKCAKDKCDKTLVSGTQIEIFCSNGATLNGESLVKCSQGRWSPDLPTCVKQTACPPLKPIKNGSFQCITEKCLEFGFHAMLDIVCDPGYGLVGTQTISCRSDGTWSSELPTCMQKNHCPTLKQVQNGSFHCITDKCMEFGYQAMLGVVCNSGFGLIGSSTLSCRADGTWSSELPQCVRLPDKSCGMPYKIQHGQWEVGGYELKYALFGTGASVVYRCDPGFRMDGDAKLVCQDDGKWSSIPPSCVAEVLCLDPGPVDNGRFECADLTSTCADYSVGTKLVFVCDEGYQRHGESQIECLDNGHWSATKPSCLRMSATSAPVTAGALGNTTTVVIATACSVLGVLMVLMLVVVAIQRRRPQSQLVHQVQPPPYSQTYTPPAPSPDPDQNHDRLALIAYDGVSLPSYDEVMTSSRHRPRVHRQADATSRQSLVTNSTVNRDGSAFGSMDTVNQSSANLSTLASTDNTSTSVTVETYDSGASVPSIAMTSRRAVAGSLASTSDTSSVHKEESPLLEPEPEFPTSSQDVEMEDFKVD